MPIKFIQPEPVKEEPVVAQPAPPAPVTDLPEGKKENTGEVKVLWEKRKTPEEIEEEAYQKRRALTPKPIEAVSPPEPIHSVPEPLESVLELPKPVEEPKPTVHTIPHIEAVKPPVAAIKAVTPEPEATKDEPEAFLPTTEPTAAGEGIQEPKSLEERVAELESTFSEFDTDLARLERLMATLSKYHPELFKKPVAAPTTQEVAEKLAVAVKQPKKEVPYVPLDPSVDGHILAEHDRMGKGLQRTKRVTWRGKC